MEAQQYKVTLWHIPEGGCAVLHKKSCKFYAKYAILSVDIAPVILYNVKMVFVFI